jgi:hypothetical protein
MMHNNRDLQTENHQDLLDKVQDKILSLAEIKRINNLQAVCHHVTSGIRCLSLTAVLKDWQQGHVPGQTDHSDAGKMK